MARQRKAKAEPNGNETTLGVSFKNVTFGDKLVSIGVSTSRTPQFNPNKADALLTGKRLTLTMYAGAGDVKEGQSTAFTDGDLEVAGVFDTSSLSVTAKRYAATLSAPISSVDDHTIRLFAKRSGRLVINAVEAGGDDDTEE